MEDIKVMAKRLLADSIYKSAKLEGLNVTLAQTEMILNNLVSDSTEEEVLFITNMNSAWEFLLGNSDYPNNLSFIRQLNKLCGEGLFYGNGVVRTSIVTIGGTAWIPDIPIESIVIDTIAEINNIQDLELKALKMFCYLARTQTFIDGNKRVAQLMANKVLIENNIGIFQVPIKRLNEFKTLLLKYYETNDDAKFIRFMQEYCITRVI